jgi:hypothetical protein
MIDNEERIKDEVIEFFRTRGEDDIRCALHYCGAAYISLMKNEGVSQESALESCKHFIQIIYNVE